MQSAENLRSRLDALIQQEISPEQFYRQYLGILMASIQGMQGCHLWLLQGSQFADLGGSDPAPILYEQDPLQKEFILSEIGVCTKAQRGHFVAGGQKGNRCQLGLAFTPLLYGQGGGATQGAQVTWWPAGNGAMLNDATLQLLDYCARSAAHIARLQKLQSMSELSEQLQVSLGLLEEIAGAPNLRSLGVTIVNRARELVECDRCALVAERAPGDLRIEAISRVPVLDPRSAVARTILQMTASAIDQGLPVLYRKASEKKEEKGDLSDYFFHSHMQEVLIVGIPRPEGKPCGALVLENEKIEQFTAPRLQMAQSIAQKCSGALQRATQYELQPVRGLAEKIAAWRMLPRDVRRRKMRSKFWIPLLVLLGVLLFPVKMEFSGDVRLFPERRAIAVAEVPGRLVQVLVEDGDRVEAGSPLARLDESDLRKQIEIAIEEEGRMQAETNRLAAQNERVAARVAELARLRAQREREFYEQQLEKTTIRSPIDGVVMTPDLQTRKGDSMPQGGQLALIGDPAAWMLQILLPEADIAPVLQRLGRGETVPVRYVLNSLPQNRFTAYIAGSDAVSSVARVINGKNIFLVTTPLPDDFPMKDLLRAGYSGRARLEIGYRPLAYTVTRRFFNWVRTNVLF